jgi:AcrR family transcriptional regulator
MKPEEIAMNIKDLKQRGLARKASPRRAKGRFGRPPKERAGEVEERILNASREVFLDRGFEGASIDDIATLARSGKPTIYARFANKRALFTAVVTRDIIARIEQFKVDVPAVGSIEERLAAAGLAVLRWILDSDRVRLLRLAIAEVRRFPDLASSVSRSARDLSTEVAARFLQEIAQSDELGTQFEKRLEALRPEVGPHVANSVAFFLAACRSGGVA